MRRQALDDFLSLVQRNNLDHVLCVPPWSISALPFAAFPFVKASFGDALSIDMNAMGRDELDSCVGACSYHGAGAVIATRSAEPGCLVVMLAHCFDDEHFIIGVTSGVEELS